MAHDQELHDHDRGLSHDLPTFLSRRRALTLLGGAGLGAALAGCGIAGNTGSSSSSSSASSTTSTASAGAQIPQETAGPYPGDGSNGVNVLTQSGIVRSDITRSFGSASGVAQGVPLTIKLKVLGSGNGFGGLQGAAIYLWHCDIDGKYSLYSEGVTQENYLRGVQETSSDGSVAFTSIYPGAYSGRWPHIHFEVYPSLKAATTASGKLRTSQLALPGAGLQAGLRHRRLQSEPAQPGANLAGDRQRLQRRLLAAAGHDDRQRDRRHGRQPQRPGVSQARPWLCAGGGSHQ